MGHEVYAAALGARELGEGDPIGTAAAMSLRSPWALGVSIQEQSGNTTLHQARQRSSDVGLFG